MSHVLTKSFVVVPTFPVVEKVIDDISAARNFQMQHQATGLQQTMTLGEDMLQRAARRFVQHDVRNHEVEALIFEGRVLGILLAEMHRYAERLGARMGVTQLGSRHIDRIDARLFEVSRPRKSAVTDRTTHVEYSRRLELLVRLQELLQQQVAQVLVARPHHPVRVDIEPEIVDRTGGDIISREVCVVTTRL